MRINEENKKNQRISDKKQGESVRTNDENKKNQRIGRNNNKRRNKENQ